MKITRLDITRLGPRSNLLAVHTDEGIVGYGEPVLEGAAGAVAQTVREFEPLLVGQDPRRIEYHWQAMYRVPFYRGGPIRMSAISGIEQALWDILGKDLGRPIYELLGGAVRERIRLYAHFGGDTPAEFAASARKRAGEGYTAIKTCPFGATRLVDTPGAVAQAAEKMAVAREAVGPDVDIGIDCHGRLSPAMAIRMARAFEPYHPMFFEEPCLPENVDTMVRVAESTSIPIATGERLFTRWGFRDVLEKQAASILQPDTSHAGGILEVRKIAAMAEVYYAALAPHCPLSAVSLAACIQVDAVCPNFLVQEQVSLGEDLLVEPFRMVDGHVELPTGPGLGIDVRPDALVRLRRDQPPDHPRLWHTDDGSIADW